MRRGYLLANDLLLVPAVGHNTLTKDEDKMPEKRMGRKEFKSWKDKNGWWADDWPLWKYGKIYADWGRARAREVRQENEIAKLKAKIKEAGFWDSFSMGGNK